ncbi:hypothetical protein [Longispora albida]|uniref:hypothetical protein n=1 Tax=Longispora albida TaxID=203523 RepID=UPI00035F3E95|nr:hypothetical protein [Longispora albida]
MNWLDVIGWAGSALLVWSLLQTRILRLRAFNLVGCLVLIGYNAARSVWPMVGLNVVLSIINVYYLRKMLATRHDERTYSVIEVDPDDQFLSYVLDQHAPDIARFNPSYRRTSGGLAFLVVSGDETAGVVLVRPEPGGIAQVELDYVTPKYRDFTPGEFVYRRSQLFAARGFHKVVTPPGMVAPYYAQLGFRPEGDSYVLDISR